MTKHKKLPKFSSESEERAFWALEDSADYIDWKQAKSVKFANLKPSTKTISLRIPEALLNDIKILAHKHDVPYQSYIKILLHEQMQRKLKGSR